jgi:trans-aconitate methyltransferase
MPNPNLTEFWAQKNIAIPMGAAVVIGCGLGDDAEWLSQRGFTTTAFDISPSAIRGARERFPGSRVRYVVADLLNPPTEWMGQFDFVLESYTLQVLPSPLRKQAAKRIADLIRPGRLALVITRARDEAEPPGHMPWPVTRREMDEIAAAGLTEISFEDYYDDESPRVRRFRALFEKTG